MSESLEDRELQALWQSQARDASTISLEQLRERAQRHERVISRRNLREYVAAALVVVWFSVMMWAWPSTMIRIGSGLSIAAALLVAGLLHRWGSVTPLPADLGLRSAVELHRQQLERQRDLLRAVWAWYLLPFVPGLVVLEIGFVQVRSGPASRVVVLGVFAAVVMVGIHFLNRYAANRIQERIDRLRRDAA
jgi:hypothetical protein